MLVYANTFLLNPEKGINDVIQQVASWVGRSRKSFVDPARLGEGIRELRFDDGAAVSSLATLDERCHPTFPYFFNARFSHGQPGVPGRRWVTEIGLRQSDPDKEVFCSILLRTDEISARVNDPILVTRPRIVELIAEHCNPAPETPGLNTITLSEENAVAFGYEVDRSDRRYPIVVISCDQDGRFPVAPERLRSVLVGIAKVIVIPENANTYRIEKIIGRKYSAFGGAINVISSYRATDSGRFCKTIIYTPDRLSELSETGSSIDSEILAVVTHQTNLPRSWQHVSNDAVREAILRRKLEKAAAAADEDFDKDAYEQLLKEAAEQLASKDRDVADARQEIQLRDATIDQLSAENQALKHSLSSAQSSNRREPVRDTLSSRALEAYRAVLNKRNSLEQSLTVISALYGERIVFLNSAYSSANESDRGGFMYGAKAVELLRVLATEYWSDLSAGLGDQQARSRFGKNSFSAKESTKLSDEGRNRRTFKYKNQTIFMEPHLKIGVKDSYAETLRIHFEWLPDDKLIVVGHCGKHLDF